MATCLFTGKELSDATRQEHLIQQCVGGRIESNEVSSTEFNQRCGDLIDERLRDTYAFILNRLGPLLPRAHKPGLLEVDVKGEPGNLVIDGEGALTIKGYAITEYDEKTRRPKAFRSSRDPATLKKLAKMGVNLNSAVEFIPFSTEVMCSSDHPVVCPDVEIAALKSLLQTFDFLLRHRADRFTRRPELQTVREFVRDAVMARSPCWQVHHQTSLGIQYQKLPLYRHLRERIDFPVTPLEHFMVVASNAAARCVDMVWLILDCDPFGFRVCHEWRGEPFAFAFVNGVIRGSTYSPLFPIDPPEELLCGPSQLKALRKDTECSSETSRAVADEIAQHRAQKLCEATWEVEMSADAHVQDMLLGQASTADAQGRCLRSLLIQRLARWYSAVTNDLIVRVDAERVVSDLLVGAPPDMASQAVVESATPAIDWAFWLKIYRDGLQAMRERFGLPGYVTVSGDRTALVDPASVPLGEQPDPSQWKTGESPKGQ
jgi:hypothetical protein